MKDHEWRVIVGRRIENRLAKLEERYQPPVCKRCWWWTETPVLVDDDGEYSRPNICPDCGREHFPQFEVHIVGVPVSAP